MAVKYSDTDTPQPARFRDKGKTYSDLVAKIKNWKQDSEHWVTTWEGAQNKWHKMRMRIKKKKNFPFVGCSNIRMPTLETKIRKLKAALTNSVFGIRPVVQVVPSPKGNFRVAKKIEKFLDHLLMDVIQIKNKSIIAIDQTLEKGFYLIKPYWKYEVTTRTETFNLSDITLQEAIWVYDIKRTPEEITQVLAQKTQADLSEMVKSDNMKALEAAALQVLAGEPEVTLYLDDVICNYPDIDLCSPERVYVPTTTGVDPQSAEYIIHEFFLPLRELKARGKNKGWNEFEVDKIEGKKFVNLSEKQTDVTKDEREGIERIQKQEELVKVWETYCWEDIDGDGVPEKSVITIAPDFDKVLRKVSLPFHSGQFPFVKLFYELIDDRWFSHRGLPEIIEDIVKEIDIQHMQKIDYGTLTNSPMFVYRAGMVNPKTVQFVFGQGIPAQGMQPLDDLIRPLQSNNPNAEMSYEREQMHLEAKVEELTGQVDYTLQSMINKREPRSATESTMQGQNMQSLFSLDADMFKRQFEKLFNWIWNLWCQYGEDQYEFSYFGREGHEPIKLSKEEIQGKYTITIRGNDQNTNPYVRQQRAMTILQDAYQALQMGLISPQAVNNARKRALQELQVQDFEEFMIPPQPQKPEDDIKLDGQDLTEIEKAQVLMKRGIKPDMAARYMVEKQKLGEAEIEDAQKLADIIQKTRGKDGQGKGRTEDK